MEAVYVSFHGGSGGYDNIHVYDLDGRELGKAIDKGTLPSGLKLKELRGFVIGPDGLLYVANAFKDYSNIVRFAPSGDTTWVYEDVFVQGDTPDNPGLWHPYDVEFDDDANLYVSSQDSGLVSRYAGPGADEPGSPLPSIVEGFPPGTFVSLQPGAYDPDQGAYPIRGITFDGAGTLYVADESGAGTGEIHTYAPSGVAGERIVSTSEVTLDSPVQVVAHLGTIYIGSSDNDAVIACSDGLVRYAVGPDGKHLDKVSGLGFDSTGRLYVGSRKNKRVLRYSLPDTTPEILLDDLDDNPEFVRVLST